MFPLTAVLFAIVTACSAQAHVAKPPVTALEGSWQVAPPPGAKAAAEFEITFAGDTVTIRFEGQNRKGTYQVVESEATIATITITITDEDVFSEKWYRGRYAVRNDQLVLCLIPQFASSSFNQPPPKYLGLASVTRILEKVKK